MDFEDRITELAELLKENANPSDRAVIVYVPGRIEVLGKHTDYAGGSSITCALNHSFLYVAVLTDEPGVRVQDLTSSKGEIISYADPTGSVTASWLKYPSTVVRRFLENFGQPERGISIAFSNTIPRAAGMSSSSAFVVGVYLALAALSDIKQYPAYDENLKTARDLAAYLGSVENGYSFRGLTGEEGVGTRGGSQDHTAILFSDPWQFGHYGYRPLCRLDTVDMPPGTSFVIASSGVRAQKTGNVLDLYNHAVTLADTALSSWNDAYSSECATVGEMISVPTFSMERLNYAIRGLSPDSKLLILDRIQQFKEECQVIIPNAMRFFLTYYMLAHTAGCLFTGTAVGKCLPAF